LNHPGASRLPLLAKAVLSKMSREAHPIKAATRLNKDAAIAATFVPTLIYNTQLIWTPHLTQEGNSSRQVTLPWVM
jgi:hypothetical protein